MATSFTDGLSGEHKHSLEFFFFEKMISTGTSSSSFLNLKTDFTANANDNNT